MSDRKRAIITGANRGIGLAIAWRLWKAGYDLLLIDYEEPTNNLPNHWFGKVDLAQPDAEAQVKKIIKGLGWKAIDSLVNNAGVAKAVRVEDLSMYDAKWMMEVNYFGALKMVKACLPLLKANGGASITNITSISGLTGFTTMGAYCASKFALNGLAMVMAKELAKYQIRVNNVCPGPTNTDMWTSLDKEYKAINGWESEEESEQAYMSKLLIKRLGTPEDVASAVEFLVDENRANYITGINLKVCGGNQIG